MRLGDIGGLGSIGGSGGQGNVPMQIAGGPAAYFDASVPSLVSIDTGVDQWTDLSGNGSHAVQVTAAEQPAYTSNVLEFDGVDDQLLAPNYSGLDNIWNGGAYCIAVVRPDSEGEAGVGRLWDVPGFSRLHAHNESAGFMRMRFFRPFSGTDADFRCDQSLVIGSTCVFEMSYDDGNVANLPTWIYNGTSLGQSTVTVPTGTASDDSGVDIYIGNSSNNAATWDGGILALALYSSIPTATEQTALRQYFARRFGVALS